VPAAVGLNTAEALTLAQQLVNREKTKGALIDDGFKKDNFVDKSDLPTWFLDEEAKHYRANIPVTKEAMNALRARQRALDARPIKKIAEAKGRKKFKAAQRLEKARKKADTLNETVDISEKEKANSISKVLARAGAKPKRKEISTVVAKGVNRGLKGRPKGVKGRYRLVDARGKKELRAESECAWCGCLRSIADIRYRAPQQARRQEDDELDVEQAARAQRLLSSVPVVCFTLSLCSWASRHVYALVIHFLHADVSSDV
jgi:hypothetical protein